MLIFFFSNHSGIQIGFIIIFEKKIPLIYGISIFLDGFENKYFSSLFSSIYFHLFIRMNVKRG